jgi:hypothetical protein
MSIAVAHWQGDFRRELDELTKNIHQNNEMGFYIERDWFLKTSLMLIDSDVRFKVKTSLQRRSVRYNNNGLK